MRKGYFYSLVFALLSVASVAATAAPEAKAVVSSVVTEAAARGKAQKVDLNSADVATLQRELAGVGEAKARAIVTYRDNNGPFASADELLEVKGIGKALLESNRDKIEVN